MYGKCAFQSNWAAHIIMACLILFCAVCVEVNGTMFFLHLLCTHIMSCYLVCGFTFCSIPVLHFMQLLVDTWVLYSTCQSLLTGQILVCFL